MQTRLPKTRRVPEAFANTKITDRCLAIIDAIGRYRFVLARDIARVVGGNEDVTHRHLQQLFHQDLISRFKLPTAPNRGEFVYFLDNATELRKLCAASVLNASDFDWDEISRNRQKYGAVAKRSAGQFLFIEHELMIARFHADIEAATRDDGNVELARWVQGPALWNTVKTDSRRTLPHRPDALFALQFLNSPDGQQRATFFYEADRETSSLARIREKLEAHLVFLLQGQQHRQYGFRRIRAVLIETLTTARANQLRMVASSLAMQFPLSASLFWIAACEENPRLSISTRCWQCAVDDSARSLAD